MKTPWKALFVAVVASSCGGLIGSHQLTTESRPVEAFDSVSVESGITAVVSLSERAVSVSADDNLIGLVETRVVNGRLVVRRDPSVVFVTASPITVTIFNPTLTALDASGGSHVTAVATPAANWPLSASGGSEVAVVAVDAAQLSVSASGGSQVSVSGRATSGTYSASGASAIHARDTTLDTVAVDANGGSDVSARASTSATGQASGGSTVFIAGGADTRVASSGGSQVNVAP